MSTEQVHIPDKIYFKIGEVCKITNLKSHTLRFWESEFKEIKPKRASGNQRLYRRVDVEIILKIKRLIYEEGRTIAGTRKFLAQEKKATSVSNDFNTKEGQPDLNLLEKIKTDLLELKSILEN